MSPGGCRKRGSISPRPPRHLGQATAPTADRPPHDGGGQEKASSGGSMAAEGAPRGPRKLIPAGPAGQHPQRSRRPPWRPDQLFVPAAPGPTGTTGMFSVHPSISPGARRLFRPTPSTPSRTTRGDFRAYCAAVMPAWGHSHGMHGQQSLRVLSVHDAPSSRKEGLGERGVARDDRVEADDFDDSLHRRCQGRHPDPAMRPTWRRGVRRPGR